MAEGLEADMRSGSLVDVVEVHGTFRHRSEAIIVLESIKGKMSSYLVFIMSCIGVRRHNAWGHRICQLWIVVVPVVSCWHAMLLQVLTSPTTLSRLRGHA